MRKELPGIVDKELRRLSPMYGQGFNIGKAGDIPDADLMRGGLRRQGLYDMFDELMHPRGPHIRNYLDEFKKPSFMKGPFEVLTGFENPVPHVQPREGDYRRGYVDGLVEFLGASQISQSRGVVGLGTLATIDGVDGFLQGVNLQAFTGTQEPRLPKGTELLNKYTIEPKIEHAQAVRLPYHARNGYRLGFMIRIAREQGVVLNWEEVPMDIVSYSAFMNGLKGKEMHFPVARAQESQQKLTIYKKIKYFSEEPQTHYAASRKAYHTGLRVWLASKGIVGYEPTWMSEPEALRAFKAALDGKVLEEYELTGKIPERLGGINKLYISEKIPDLKMEPTDADVVRGKAFMAYHLGKVTRNRLRR